MLGDPALDLSDREARLQALDFPVGSSHPDATTSPNMISPGAEFRLVKGEHFGDSPTTHGLPQYAHPLSW